MNKNELHDAYFEWMYRLVCKGRYFRKRLSYRKLLSRLHDTEFTYTIRVDENRARDGVDLRYYFGHDNSIQEHIIKTVLDIQPCSVLEMMIALAIRCEKHIMDDPDEGDRTGRWFWGMVANLGLQEMSEMRFDMAYVDDVVSRFLNREYAPNGEGGLFTVDSKNDLRTAEIWYQMCWYLDTV